MSENQYLSLRDKISAEKIERQERYVEYERILNAAYEKGLEAGRNIMPTPMVVSGGGTSYYVPEGVCGFAWVHIRRANAGFGKWLLHTKRGRRGYPSGVDIWVSEFNQSHARKYAAAQVIADELRQRGIDASARERLD